jgi:hypothetical protein
MRLRSGTHSTVRAMIAAVSIKEMYSSDIFCLAIF